MRSASVAAERVHPHAADLGHLPGEEGLPIGLGNLFGWTRNGVAHLVEKERRFGPSFARSSGLSPSFTWAIPR
jgi:hypothetical protein